MTHLDARWCGGMSEKAVRAVVTGCPRLTRLELSPNAGVGEETRMAALGGGAALRALLEEEGAARAAVAA